MSDNNGTGPKMLSADDILTATELEERTVEVPALGGSVRIREFDKGTQQWIRQQAKDRRTGELNEGKLELLLFAYGIIEPKFSLDQVQHLRKVKASVLDPVLREITELSGMTDTAVKAEEATFPEE